MLTLSEMLSRVNIVYSCSGSRLSLLTFPLIPPIIIWHHYRKKRMITVIYARSPNEDFVRSVTFNISC